MDVQYLFNSSGQWIAFRLGKYVFNTEGEWIGWLPWEEPDVVDKSGNYLGTIYPEGRFYKTCFNHLREYPGYPGYPDYPGYPGYPGFKGFSPLPAGTEDLKELSLVS
ncbi:MAG: 4-fold beta flower protein [Phormidesmis sp.]